MLGVRPAEGWWAYRRPVLGVRFRAKAAQAAAGIGAGSPALVLSRKGGQVHLAGMPTVIWIQFRLASTGPAGSSIFPAAVSSSTSRPGDQQQDDQHRARTGVERQVPAGRPPSMDVPTAIPDPEARPRPVTRGSGQRRQDGRAKRGELVHSTSSCLPRALHSAALSMSLLTSSIIRASTSMSPSLNRILLHVRATTVFRGVPSTRPARRDRPMPGTAPPVPSRNGETGGRGAPRTEPAAAYGSVTAAVVAKPTWPSCASKK
ncbi:hypothetical protein [Azospirillum argentinense]